MTKATNTVRPVEIPAKSGQLITEIMAITGGVIVVLSDEKHYKELVEKAQGKGFIEVMTFNGHLDAFTAMKVNFDHVLLIGPLQPITFNKGPGGKGKPLPKKVNDAAVTQFPPGGLSHDQFEKIFN